MLGQRFLRKAPCFDGFSGVNMIGKVGSRALRRPVCRIITGQGLMKNDARPTEEEELKGERRPDVMDAWIRRCCMFPQHCISGYR